MSESNDQMDLECNNEMIKIIKTENEATNTSTTSSLINISEEKVVMATPPVQVVMQQSPLVPTHPTRVPLVTTKKPPYLTKVIVRNSSRNIKTIPFSKSSVTLSPIKSGFKIPISPNKQPVKLSVIPTSNNLVKTINFATSIKKQPKSSTNFQFQTTQATNKIVGNNNQTFTIQTINQNTNTRTPCTVRLIPTTSQTSQSLLPIQVTGDQKLQPTTPKVIQQQQPFVSFQHIKQLQPLKPRLIMPASSISTSTTPKITNIITTATKPTNNMSYALIPAKYVEQFKKVQPPTMYGPDMVTTNQSTPSQTPETVNRVTSTTNQQPLTVNGKLHKPCNCTKSMCLKLYCECFANGHFCDGCNCINCHNNLEYDTDRSKAIRSCLDRNPYAFRPKIGRGRDDSRTHQKGCNCRRSGCLKNYCECYEARIPCTSRCKCIGCKNLEGCWPASRGGKNQRSNMNQQNQSLMNLADAAAARCQQQQAASSRLSSHIEDMRRGSLSVNHRKTNQSAINTSEKQPSTFFTDEVIDATCVCLLAQAEEAEKSHRSEQAAEQAIVEEFGKCLMQIIEAARKTKVVPTTNT